MVLDADALTVIASEAADAGQHGADRLRAVCGPQRAVVCTPHVGEFGRLLGRRVSDEWQARADAARDFAVRAHATVLLKGTPTLLASPTGDVTAIPRGSAVLATGGSGDVLTGMIGALLAQGAPPQHAALLAAHAHGGAAELVARRGVRGHTLDDVLQSLPAAWRELEQPAVLPPGVLADLIAPEGVT